MKRRQFLQSTALTGLAAAALPAFVKADASQNPALPEEKRFQSGQSPWPVSLDTATIRPATLVEKIQIAAKAGYDAIEPWDNELEKFEAEGGNLKDLGKQIKDLGLIVPSVIGLWNALPPTKEEWEKSLPATRNRMRMGAAIGSQHIQTIPNTVGNNYSQKWVADRYKDIINIGINDYNILPAIVFVKYFPVKSMGQAMAIAMDANHPKAAIIPDVYHMYICEGGFEGLKLLNGDSIAIFQFNDAPASPAFAQLNDEHRVHPGDGILPLPEIFKTLKSIGYKGCISLEMYNPNYWKQNLLEVAKTGLTKTLETLRKAKV